MDKTDPAKFKNGLMIGVILHKFYMFSPLSLGHFTPFWWVQAYTDVKPGSYRHREVCYLCRAVAYFDAEGEDQTDLLYTNWGRDSAYRDGLLRLQSVSIAVGDNYQRPWLTTIGM